MQAVNNPFDNINSLFVPQPVNLSPAVHVDTLKNRLNRVIQMKDIIRDHPNLSVLANTHNELKAIEKETQEELTQTQFFADSILNVSNTTLKELQKEAGVALRPYLDHLSGLIDQIPYEVLEKQADSIPSLKKQIHQFTLLDKTGKQQLVDKLSDILRYVVYLDSYHKATEENKPFVRTTCLTMVIISWLLNLHLRLGCFSTLLTQSQLISITTAKMAAFVHNNLVTSYFNLKIQNTLLLLSIRLI